jgi:hypothetical protein
MPDTWIQHLAALKLFIAENPSMEIGTEVTRIPGEIRPEFYRLFDEVRRSFLQNRFQTLLTEGETMGKAFTIASKAITLQLGLGAIELNADLQAFFDDSVSGLMPLLFDPLFDLLKSITTEKEYEDTAVKKIRETCRVHFNDGYLFWSILSLISLLEPCANYCVPSRDEHCDSLLGDATPDHYFEEKIPHIEPCRRLSFQQVGLHHAFRLPRVMVQSTRLKQYVGIYFKFDDSEAFNRAIGKSQRREWFQVKDIICDKGATNLWPDIALYAASDPADIALVADYLDILRPEICIEVRPQKGWLSSNCFEKIIRHHQVLNPLHGTYVISMQGLMKENISEEQNTLPSDINIIAAGYAPESLEPIIEALESEQRTVAQGECSNL